MSTRGAYGFKINKEIKVIMSPYDSYPQGLGADIINFLQKVDVDRLVSKVAELQSIPQNLIKNNILADKEIWREPSQVLQAIYTGTLKSFFDAQEFLSDPLFCEYFYLINLDNKTLECYQCGNFISLGNYSFAKLGEPTLFSMAKAMKKNESAKADLLGFPSYVKKKTKKL